MSKQLQTESHFLTQYYTDIVFYKTWERCSILNRLISPSCTSVLLYVIMKADQAIQSITCMKSMTYKVSVLLFLSIHMCCMKADQAIQMMTCVKDVIYGSFSPTKL